MYVFAVNINGCEHSADGVHPFSCMVGAAAGQHNPSRSLVPAAALTAPLSDELDLPLFWLNEGKRGPCASLMAGGDHCGTCTVHFFHLSGLQTTSLEWTYSRGPRRRSATPIRRSRSQGNTTPQGGRQAVGSGAGDATEHSSYLDHRSVWIGSCRQGKHCQHIESM